VEPTEGLDLLEEVEVVEVFDQLRDEGGVDGPVEGIVGEFVLEVVEDLGGARVESATGLLAGWTSCGVRERSHRWCSRGSTSTGDDGR
jgi:hypothetical protein